MVLKEGVIDDAGQKDADRQAAALPLHRRRRAMRRTVTLDALRVADEDRPKVHLLPDRRHAGRGAQQPASRGLRRLGHRGAAAHRPHRRMGREPSARIRGQDARERRRAPPADVASAIETPEKAAAESRLQGNAGASRQDPRRQDRERQRLGPAHGFAGRAWSRANSA